MARTIKMVGFEVHIDGSVALKWLATNSSDVRKGIGPDEIFR